MRTTLAQLFTVALLVTSAVGGAVQQADGESRRGEVLFKERCAACHEKKYPRAPFVHYLRQMMPQAIYAILTEGAMRPYAADLPDRDKRLIAEYLTGQSLNTRREVLQPPKCAAQAAPFDPARFPAVRSWGVDLENSRFTPGEVARLSAEDVRKLRLKWAFSFPGAQRARSQPTVAGGRLFVGSQSGEVHGLDAKSGCRHWVFQASGEVRTAVTIDGDALYFGDTFGNVYSIGAADGKPRWKVKADEHPAATNTGSPVAYRGRVFVPLSAMGNFDVADPHSSCCTNRGAVIALEAATGRMLWKTYTIPNAPVEQLRNHAGTPQLDRRALP